MSDVMIGSLVLVTPLHGPTVLGKVVVAQGMTSKESVGRMDGLDCGEGTWRLEEAIICERVQIPTGRPGQFEMSYLTMPLDVFDMSPRTVYVIPAMFIEVPQPSKLADLYFKTLDGWRIQRSGLLSATPLDMDKILGRGKMQ